MKRRPKSSRERSTSRPAAPIESEVLERLRKLCTSLSDTSETRSFGHPTFQVAQRTYCVLETYRGELCIVFKAELPVQQALVQSPRFFVAPYIGRFGWTSLRCASGLDWGEIGDLVRESHRLVRAMKPAARKRAPKPAGAKTVSRPGSTTRTPRSRRTAR